MSLSGLPYEIYRVFSLSTAVGTWGTHHSMWRAKYRNDPAWVKAAMEEAMQEVAKVRPHIVPVQAGAAVGDY